MESSKEEKSPLEGEMEDKTEVLAEALQAMEEKIFHYEKMAMLGQLMSGIAHEVNTPLAALNSNSDTFIRCIKKIKEKIFHEEVPASIREDQKLLMLFENIDKLSEINKNASVRIVEIVNSVRRYARKDDRELIEANLNELLDSTLPILYHEFKNRIIVHRDFKDISPVSCYPTQIKSGISEFAG